MRYYTINNGLLIADSEQALSRYYKTPIYPLPDDFEEGKYIIENNQLVLNPNWDEEQYIKREAQFHKEFFNTSLGYIRRTVSMKDGNKKDFLGELLMPIKAGLELGQQVTIITYIQPDFSEDVTDWTQYQELKQATPQFIQECLNQIVIDFQGIEG